MNAAHQYHTERLRPLELGEDRLEEEVEVLRGRPEFKTFVDVAIVAARLLLPLLKGESSSNSV